MGRAGAVHRQREDEEGVTHYEAGDDVVSNNSDGSDAYAIDAAKFEALYPSTPRAARRTRRFHDSQLDALAALKP